MEMGRCGLGLLVSLGIGERVKIKRDFWGACGVEVKRVEVYRMGFILLVAWRAQVRMRCVGLVCARMGFFARGGRLLRSKLADMLRVECSTLQSLVLVHITDFGTRCR